MTASASSTETSLDHTQFRQYTSQLARWLSPDPAGLAAVDPMNPQSWNRYAYVLDDPMNFVDPTGQLLIGPQGTPGGSGTDPSNPFDPTGNGSVWSAALNGSLVPVYGSPILGAFEPWAVYTMTGSPYSQLGVESLVWDIFYPVIGWTSFGAGSGPANGNTGRGGGGNTSGGGSTLDDRANALANAINKTGVQSLGNPCTVGAFYLGSAAGGGLVATGMNAAGVEETATTYWPQGLQATFNWLYQQSLRAFPTVTGIVVNGKQNVIKAINKVQNGCNAMQ